MAVIPDPDPDGTEIAPGGARAGAGFVGWWAVLVGTIFLGLLAAGLAYMVIAFFPTDKSSKDVNYFGISWKDVSRDTLLFVIVLATGALGGATHALRSLSWYFGLAKLLRRWMLMYVALPFVGALLALFFYLLLRGGLLTAQGSTTDINAYGFAAIGAVVGLFSEQATKKLLDVFSTIFASAAQGSDHQLSQPTGAQAE